jgi:outer membrane lipoprotein-sorting protein
MQTATDFFDKISENYADVEDYEAKVVITQGEDVMTGVLYFKSPNRLRIDFKDPKEQVIASNGSVLTLYLPGQSVIMMQKLTSSGTRAKGLSILKINYSVSYLNGNPNPVFLDEFGEDLVVKLKLDWKSTEEGFRQIEIAVGADGFIRRMTGITQDMLRLTFDFTDVRINQDIPDIRFDYEAPSSAYIINNFLFSVEE